MSPKLHVFVDFDGVFHPTGACTWLPGDVQPHFVQPFRWWPQFRDALRPLDKDVVLVAHTTWRLQWEHDAELFAWLPEQMRAKMVGCTPRTHCARAASIEAYVHAKQLKHYVVIDDEPDAFAPGYERLVVCDPARGISDEDTQGRLFLKVKAGLQALAASAS